MPAEAVAVPLTVGAGPPPRAGFARGGVLGPGLRPSVTWRETGKKSSTPSPPECMEVRPVGVGTLDSCTHCHRRLPGPREAERLGLILLAWKGAEDSGLP